MGRLPLKLHICLPMAMEGRQFGQILSRLPILVHAGTMGSPNKATVHEIVWYWRKHVILSTSVPRVGLIPFGNVVVLTFYAQRSMTMLRLWSKNLQIGPLRQCRNFPSRSLSHRQLIIQKILWHDLSLQDSSALLWFTSRCCIVPHEWEFARLAL